MDDVSSGPRRLSRAEFLAKAQTRRAQIAEQNATDAARAQERVSTKRSEDLVRCLFDLRRRAKRFFSSGFVDAP
jgi:hypothetical protein